MTNEVNRLTAIEVKTKPAGRYSDGANLFLNVSPSGARSWSFIFRFHGRTRHAGLGPLARVSLKDARERAAEGRALLGKGQDPIEVWRTAKRAAERPTFAEAVKEYHAAHCSEWRSEKHAAEWKRSLYAFAKPLMRLKVDEITAEDILACLKPVWNRRRESASRVRGRIEKVLGAAKAAGHIDKDKLNIARWKDGLEFRLAKKSKATHFRALPYQEAPTFIAELRERRFTPEGAYVVPAFALEWLILTACRSNEVFGATWNEVDLDAKGGPIWSIPPERTKRNREHVVPLTEGALAILEAMAAIKGEPFVIPGRDGKPPRECAPFVFPGRMDHAPLGNMAFVTILRHMKVDATAHGFRSAIRDFLGNETATPRDVCEAVLAHAVGDMTEQAYRRVDALAKRRIAMGLWDDFLRQPVDNVVPLAARAAKQ
jgi:integrase